MASGSFPSQWAWPDERNGNGDSTTAAPATDEPTAGAAGASDDGPPPAPQPKQRHYKPRTCRICLEVVNPSTDIDDSLAGRVFSSKARVRYVSEDPELGRLISPCKCKGSQKHVHEGCLQAWRNASPLSDRNYWRCPTCQFEYRVQRLRWGRWISSRAVRAVLTAAVMVLAVFVLGFVADPIINFWLDPLGSIAGTLVADVEFKDALLAGDDEPATWSFHFVKGFLSLGLLGFIKTMLVMSPWNWFNIRLGGGGRRRARGGDRLEAINWALVVVGVLTFLGVSRIHVASGDLHALLTLRHRRPGSLSAISVPRLWRKPAIVWLMSRRMKRMTRMRRMTAPVAHLTSRERIGKLAGPEVDVLIAIPSQLYYGYVYSHMLPLADVPCHCRLHTLKLSQLRLRAVPTSLCAEMKLCCRPGSGRLALFPPGSGGECVDLRLQSGFFGTPAISFCFPGGLPPLPDRWVAERLG